MPTEEKPQLAEEKAGLPVGGQLGCKQRQPNRSLLFPNMALLRAQGVLYSDVEPDCWEQGIPMTMSYSSPRLVSLVAQAVLNLWQLSCLSLLGAGNIGASSHAWLGTPVFYFSWE